MKKIIVLGLDGATFNLIEPWVKEGKLPNFKKLMKKGSFQKLRSILPPVTCICWPSIYTGKNPGEHGIFEWGKIDRKKAKIGNIYTPKDVKSKFLWEILQEKDYKCGVINIPFSSPFRKKPFFGEGDHLRKEWVNLEWKEKDTNAGITPENKYFNKRILDVIDLRIRQLRWIIKNKNFDFLAFNIYVIDPLQHFRWNNKDILLKAYKRIDRGLSKISNILNKEDILFIISDHGMIKTDGYFFINNWLEKEGYLRLKKNSTKKNKVISQKNIKKLANPLIRAIHKTGLFRFVPNNLRKMYPRSISFLPSGKTREIPFKEMRKNIDLENTKAYAVSKHGKLYVNDKNTLDEIIKKLKCFAEENNLKIKIFKKEELYEGRYVEYSPDVVIEINGGKIQIQNSFNSEDKILTDGEESPVKAQHELDGIYMCNKKIKLEKNNILDIFPTIMNIFNEDEKQ